MIGVTVGWQFLAFIMAFTSMGFLVSLLKRPSLVWLFTLGEILLFGIATISKQWVSLLVWSPLVLTFKIKYSNKNIKLLSGSEENVVMKEKIGDSVQSFLENFFPLIINFYLVFLEKVGGRVMNQ